MWNTATGLAAKYKKTAVGLGVAGIGAISLAINPELALFAAELFDILEGIARGIAEVGAEVSRETVAE